MGPAARALAEDRVVQELVLPHDVLVILIGAAGCGKSRWARQRFPESWIVSSDECRRLVADDEADQAASRQAFDVFHTLIRARLSLARPTVADATNLRRHARTALLHDAARYQRPVVAVAFDVPLALCLERARGRERTVHPEVIERQHARFRQLLPELTEEGYATVYVVRPASSPASVPER